jgi:hypothetical protein
MSNKLKTTINFVAGRLDLVQKSSTEHGIPYKKLIQRCLKIFISCYSKDIFQNCTLCYQEDHPHWKKVHFTMSTDEYDVYFDLKKVNRCSFSLIVAMAIDNYLEMAIGGYNEDSYPAYKYLKKCINEENYPIYIFSWIETEKTEKILRNLKE